tara:strand:+ start:629 stop:1465 length:837 start_codon:yes stop_codon:yes gene_type:complete
MAIENQGTVRPLAINDIFRFQPYYRELPYEIQAPSTKKGTEIMDAVLLDQYQQKPILRKYFLAFVEEIDLLFNSIDQVYFGRMIDEATGVSLDAIGRIIDQGREVIIPGGKFFGVVPDENVVFPSNPTAGDTYTEDDRIYTWDGTEWTITSSTRVSDVEAHKMATSSDPSDGGVFKDGWYGNFLTVPLNDLQFRRVLKAKAGVHNRHCISMNQMYTAASTVLGMTPRHLKIASTGLRRLEIQLSIEDVSEADANILQYFTKYLAPLGTIIEVVRTDSY